MIGSSSCTLSARRLAVRLDRRRRRTRPRSRAAGRTSRPVMRRLGVHHRVAEFAGLKGVRQRPLGRREERHRQRVPSGFTTLNTATGFSLLKLVNDTFSSGERRLVAEPVDLDLDRPRLAEHLAVADPRLADAHLQPEVALQAVLLHLQVQRAHAAHQRLAGVLVGLHRERRVFAAGACSGRRPACPCRPPLSGSIDWLTTASANVIGSSRIGCCGVAERVAGDRVLQADDARRCRRPGRLGTSSSPRFGSAWTWKSLPMFSFTSLPGL